MRRNILALAIIFLLVLPFKGYPQEAAYRNAAGLEPVGLRVDNLKGASCLNFIMKVNNATDTGHIIDTRQESKKLLEYFFSCLIQPKNRFWVNLNPNEPNRIIEYELGKTDIGRIMLEADMRIKRDVSSLLNPRSSEIGRKYWKALYAKAEELKLGPDAEISSQTRVWIVPDRVVISEKDDRVYITESNLQLKLESDYFLLGKKQAKNTPLSLLEDYSSELMRQLILPELTRRVNNDSDYAFLRQVYSSLILSQWYKEKFSASGDYLTQAMDASILEGLDLDFKKKPEEIFEEYLNSLTKGEYDFEYNLADDSLKTRAFFSSWLRRRYFSGGLDLRNFKFIKASSSVSQGTVDSNSENILTCAVTIPHKTTGNPLRYAENALEVISGYFKDLPFMNNLPSVSPVGSASGSENRLFPFMDDINRLVQSRL